MHDLYSPETAHERVSYTYSRAASPNRFLLELLLSLLSISNLV